MGKPAAKAKPIFDASTATGCRGFRDAPRWLTPSLVGERAAIDAISVRREFSAKHVRWGPPVFTIAEDLAKGSDAPPAKPSSSSEFFGGDSGRSGKWRRNWKNALCTFLLIDAAGYLG